MSIQSEQNDRKVVIGVDMTDDDAKKLLAGHTDSFRIEEGAIPEFTTISKYRGFKVEHTTLKGDLVLHFFLPKHAQLNSPEARNAWMSYWLNKFPAKLDEVAQRYFEAGYPRLMAKYTSEVASWWFKAQGFGEVLDAGAFLQGFFDQLEAALSENGQAAQGGSDGA